MSTTPEPSPAPEQPPGAGRLPDALLRVAGGVVAVLGALVTGLIELIFAGWARGLILAQRSILSALLVGAPSVIAGLLLVVLAAIALSRFAHRAVGSGWALTLPALPWFGLMVVAASRTSEGDLLLPGNNWLGLAMVLAGSLTFAVMGYRLILAASPGFGPARPGG